ncbi:sensor histidine kinase [Paenibacillus herberti]|uniref:histidine kinase n=1 Tax=Paenibacillus herberti TaxID=1619309 RepID=A0A229NUR4_9BACL|nr:HAMP domain-containing sensor histidine kinase [Paenibacillus herberti]OXM13631.1 two-component sensor histidine kinase [Paenibacillus herberti]
MKRIRIRLALHFTYQVVLLWVFILLLIVLSTLLSTQYFVNRDLKRTFSSAALESIQLDSVFKDGKVTVNKRWDKLLMDNGYWLQIIDYSGAVIYSSPADNELKTSYGAGELLRIRETRRMGPYHVVSSLLNETESDEKAALYLMGKKDKGASQLETWFGQYAENGVVRDSGTAELNRQLNDAGNTLQIVNGKGEIVQSLGSSGASDSFGGSGSTHGSNGSSGSSGSDNSGDSGGKTNYSPLELISMRAEPGNYPVDLSFYLDESSDYVWLIQQKKPSGVFVSQSLFREVIVVLAIFAGLLLLSSLFISIWHGYRYGQPLMLFTSWFERMSQGKYSEALTEKERKKVFRRNGKIRFRYRLYKEMIAGFYEMATKLDSSQRELRRLEQTREEWMTGISHDLRTPLSTIQGYGHLLESGEFAWDEKELREVGRTIRDKGDYMLGLLQDFSLTFQLRNNTVSFPLEPIECNEFVRRTVLRYVNDATIEGIGFAYEEWERDLLIAGSPKWLQRMLDNLLVNAVKHNPRGTQVTVRVLRQATEALIEVSDDGIGLDEETQSKLFDRYYRGTSTDESTEGAGLGMSIARSIAIAHSGRISVKSNPGQGTTVVVAIPLQKSRSADIAVGE